jgi:hypothetical protein
MYIEVLGLDPDEAVGDLLETLAHGLPMSQGLLEAEIPDIIADQFQAQEGRRFLVLFEKGVAVPGAEHVHALIDPFHHVLELAADPPGIVFAKQGDNPVGRFQACPAQEPGSARMGSSHRSGGEAEGQDVRCWVFVAPRAIYDSASGWADERPTPSEK